MKRSGFTLVELIIAIIMVLVVGALILTVIVPWVAAPTEFVGVVEQKYRSLDGDGARLYRIQVRKPSGEVDEWNSYFIHDKVTPGQRYRFKARGVHLTDAVFVPSSEE